MYWLWTTFLATVAGRLAQTDTDDACAGLAQLGDTLIPGYHSEIYAAKSYPDGTNFVPENYSQPTVVPNLPAFCRFGAFFNTSDNSRVQFEVWLPNKDKWNGRFAFVGNGGNAGFVFYSDMGIPLSKYGFAVASTDTGHNGTVADGSFAINNTETQYDFGHRAVHLSTVFSKNVVSQYYETSQEDSFKSYWLGCSSGGKQGLKEVQAYPEDYDGVIAGSPAYWWSHLNGWTVQSNLLNAIGSEGYINGTTWLQIHNSVISQCDALDGLQDGLITNPALCKPDFSLANITEAQVKVAESVYTDWRNGTDGDGELLFPAFSPGAEYAGPAFVSGIPFPPGPDYFLYQVLNFTQVTTNHKFTTSELVSLVAEADITNPGLTTVDDWDIGPFIERGGKLITYVGMADSLIPTGSSIYHHDRVVQTLGYDPRDSFRLFTVPGMGHCSGGYAPSSFGGPQQSDVTLGGAGQSAELDVEHDMILALLEWTESGRTPDSIIATKYVNDNKTEGVEFQRPLCPYPEFATYVDGDANNASSFICSE